MFFLASKLLDVAVDPVWWCFALLTTGVVLLARQRRRRLGVGLATAGLGVLFLAALPAVANRLWFALEAGATSTERADVTYDAVVLFGGTVEAGGAMPDEVAWNENVDRLTVVFDLLRTGRARRAIVSGGTVSPGLPTEAAYLKAQLVAWGIPEAQVELEPEARNTRENAVFSQKLLAARGDKAVLLVTSAFHMPRSAGCFRAVGIEADLRPVDYSMRAPSRDPHWAPRGEYVADTTRALREFLGRVVYRMLGYSK